MRAAAEDTPPHVFSPFPGRQHAQVNMRVRRLRTGRRPAPQTATPPPQASRSPSEAGAAHLTVPPARPPAAGRADFPTGPMRGSARIGGLEQQAGTVAAGDQQKPSSAAPIPPTYPASFSVDPPAEGLCLLSQALPACPPTARARLEHSS